MVLLAGGEACWVWVCMVGLVLLFVGGLFAWMVGFRRVFSVRFGFAIVFVLDT